VPDTDLRRAAPATLQNLLAGFPLPNGERVMIPDKNGVFQPNGLAYFTSAYSNPGSIDSPSIRVDHHLNDRMNLFGRFQTSPSELISRSTSYTLSNIARTLQETKVVTLGADTIISVHLANQGRFNSSWSNWQSYYTTDDFGGARSLGLANYFTQEVGHWSQAYIRMNFGGTPGIFFANQSSPQHQWNLIDSKPPGITVRAT
jgi:hypothetical protein